MPQPSFVLEEPEARFEPAPPPQKPRQTRRSAFTVVGLKERRGPLRPKTLVSARERRAHQMQNGLLRLADRVALAGAAVLAADVVSGFSLLKLTAATAAGLALAAVAGSVALSQLSLYQGDASDQGYVRRLSRIGVAIALGAVLASMLALALGDFARAAPAFAIWMATALAWSAGLHVLARRDHARWAAAGALTPNIVLVGATEGAERLIKAALKRRDINVVGVFDDRLARAPDEIEGVPVLGPVASLMGHRVLPHIDRVVIAVDPCAKKRVRSLGKKLAVLPNEVSLLVDVADSASAEAALARIAGASIAKLSGPPEVDHRLVVKRVTDLTLSAFALLVLAPLLGVVALLVKLDSKGPVFFRQCREGFNGENITVWKFRTMRHEAADATASRQVTADDDRITRVGRELRRLSLDEVPQLLNVLSGEMSLVGPRPHAIGMKTGGKESAQLVAEYACRHRMKPGLTGWAAVNGSRGPMHAAADVRRRVALDLEYVERQSFWLDAWIMLKTLPCLLGDREAVR